MAAGPPVVAAAGRLWQVEAPLGRGSSAAVFRARCLGHPCAPPAAVKEFLPPSSGPGGGGGGGGDYGFRKERAALEELRGHRNIVTLYGMFTNCASTKGPSHSLLLELLDVSVSELLVHSSQQGCSMWMTQHCARDVLEALAFLHHKGYVHADLKPRNILWSAEQECFKLIDFGLSFKEGNQLYEPVELVSLHEQKTASKVANRQREKYLFPLTEAYYVAMGAGTFGSMEDVKYIQTDGYRAPEAELQNYLSQAGLQGGTQCTSAVDLWSLGIVLVEMFSGMKLKHIVHSWAWKANNAAVIDQIFVSKSVENSAIPAYHLRDLLKSMLHEEQEKRATAAEALCSPFFSIPFAPHIEDLVMLPTPVLRLLNILGDAALQNDEEFEDAVDDIREECSKYGQIVSLFAPKENPGQGQVFVEYANAGVSKAAQRALTGKRFDGKFVVATFYPLSAYKRGYVYQTVH